MKKTIRAFLLVVIFAGAFGCSFLRLFQLLRYTDAQTGLVWKNPQLSYIVYGVLLALFVLCAFYGLLSDRERHIELSHSRLITLGSLGLAVLFFGDFLHQCYNCFVYFDTTSRIEYNYIIPLGFSGVMALVCCFYLITVAQTSRGSGVDFRSFTVPHFSVAVWAFSRLVMIMVKLVNVTQGIESAIEFLSLVALLSFVLSAVSAIDKGEGNVSRLFVFCALMTFCFCTVLAFPRMVAYLSGRVELLFDAGFTSTVYFALGMFSFLLIIKSNERVKKD